MAPIAFQCPALPSSLLISPTCLPFRCSNLNVGAAAGAVDATPALCLWPNLLPRQLDAFARRGTILLDQPRSARGEIESIILTTARDQSPWRDPRRRLSPRLPVRTVRHALHRRLAVIAACTRRVVRQNVSEHTNPASAVLAFSKSKDDRSSVICVIECPTTRGHPLWRPGEVRHDGPLSGEHALAFSRCGRECTEWKLISDFRSRPDNCLVLVGRL
jgi:hypothetical protein